MTLIFLILFMQILYVDFANPLSIQWDMHRKCLDFETSGEWSTEGCTTLNFDGNLTTCACTHTTSFVAVTKPFVPETNTVEMSDIRNVNIDNLIEYPVPFLTCLCIILINILGCVLIDDNSSKPVLAVDRVLPK